MKRLFMEEIIEIWYQVSNFTKSWVPNSIVECILYMWAACAVYFMGSPLTKNKQVCALSQNYQQLFEKYYASYSKLSKKLKNGIRI